MLRVLALPVVLALLVGLVACAHSGAVDDARQSFRARGNEPGWRLDIEGDRITLVMQNGRRLTTAAPAAQRADAFTRYAARAEGTELTVTIFNRPCRDSMTGMPHPNAVEVVYGNRKLVGCGGDPAALLQGREWMVADINGKGISDQSHATLAFGADGRVSGRASCNNYFASYTLAGEGLTISQAGGTMMACAPALMQQEALFLEILRNVRRFDLGGDGALVLRTDDGRTITARADGAMRPTLVAIAVTLAVQTLTSMAMIAPSVLAPVAARDLGLAPQSIGFFASLTYLGAMVSGLAAGRFTARYGPLAVCQAAVVLAGAGLLLGWLAVAAVVPIAALVIGLGYGVVNPVSSHILARRTPAGMMSLVFSIKQTGVPVGGAIAGVLAPPLALALGWAGALPVLAAVCVAAAFVLVPARATLAEPRIAAVGPGGLRGVFAGLGRPIRVALSSRPLREMSFASLGYAAVQLVFITYFVSYLALGLGYSLVTAGLVYASAHGAGIVGRIAWGAVADRWLAPRLTLALLGAISAVCALLAAAFSPDWPLAAVIAVGMLFGASAVGWNGVFLAEVARVAPPGMVTTATGGTQFFTFAGALSGPPLFAAAVWATGSYAWAFGLFAAPSAAVAVRLLARR